MGVIIKNYLLLIFLILLQSCSGGIIGNFLESSFKDAEEIKTEVKLKSNSNTKKDSEEKSRKNKKEFKEIKTEVKLKNNSNTKKYSEEKSRKNKKFVNKGLKKRKYNPQSYKIIFILKDVDPKSPIEEISEILRNSDVNFEIEKIERFVDSDNKNLKKNNN